MSILYGQLENGQIKSKNVLERLLMNSTGDSDDECWEFLGKDVNRGGHKRIRLDDKKRIFVHRLAWEAYNAEPVPEGLLVLHHCDNPCCFNPHHLYAGTAKDNVADMFRRNRANVSSKIPLEEKALIEQSTEPSPVLAKKYGVTSRRIRQIRSAACGQGR
jgi:hypothetical protein